MTTVGYRSVLEHGPSCQVGVPGVQAFGPGYFLVAANKRVECGPFDTEQDASKAAEWLEDQSLGVHPYPWRVVYTPVGLLVGSKCRAASEPPSRLW